MDLENSPGGMVSAPFSVIVSSFRAVLLFCFLQLITQSSVLPGSGHLKHRSALRRKGRSVGLAVYITAISQPWPKGLGLQS